MQFNVGCRKVVMYYLVATSVSLWLVIFLQEDNFLRKKRIIFFISSENQHIMCNGLAFFHYHFHPVALYVSFLLLSFCADSFTLWRFFFCLVEISEFLHCPFVMCSTFVTSISARSVFTSLNHSGSLSVP